MLYSNAERGKRGGGGEAAAGGEGKGEEGGDTSGCVL